MNELSDHSEPLLQPGTNCWQVARAERAAVIVDARDYFALAKQAMLKAEKQLILVGWDFDTRITLEHSNEEGHRADGPSNLGAFILWLAKHRPELQISILKWDLGILKSLGRGTTPFTLMRWAAHPRITFKLDGAHPKGASHHQKIVVIDDRLAFCGGIDMTGSRWDTRQHLPGDDRRKRPFTRRRYPPWHDATMAVDGEVAAALGKLCRTRWEAAGGDKLQVPDVQSDPWPDVLEPSFRGIDIGIARTIGKRDGQEEVRENERLFIDLIESARTFIYAESQYFASRLIAKALCKRLQEPDAPECILVQPRTADGWLEEEVMGTARYELLQFIKQSDLHDRFRIYTPVNEDGEDIYVHAKIMIVDDRVLRVGSSNMNNRSLGLDSECDLVIDAAVPENRGASEQIKATLDDLLAEHLGCSQQTVAEHRRQTGSLIATIDALAKPGRTLSDFHPPEPNSAEFAIANSEALDPERAEGSFEPMGNPGLLSGFRK